MNGTEAADRVNRVSRLAGAIRVMQEIEAKVETIIAQVEGATPQNGADVAKDQQEPTLCSILNDGPDYLHSRNNTIQDRLTYLGEILQ